MSNTGAVGVIKKMNQENPLYPDQFINDDSRHQQRQSQGSMNMMNSPDQIQPRSRQLAGSISKPPKNQYLAGLESQRSANRDNSGAYLRQSM